MLSKYPWNESLETFISPINCFRTRSSNMFLQSSYNFYNYSQIFNPKFSSNKLTQRDKSLYLQSNISNKNSRLPSILSTKHPQTFIELNSHSIITNKAASRKAILPKIQSSALKEQQQAVLESQHVSDSKQTNNNDTTYPSESDESTSSITDKEFQRYVRKATVKCADWLVKYVFNQTYDSDNEEL